MNIKEVLNIKELWLFWIAIICFMFSIFTYNVFGSPVREYLIFGSTIFFIIAVVVKFIK